MAFSAARVALLAATDGKKLIKVLSDSMLSLTLYTMCDLKGPFEL